MFEDEVQEAIYLGIVQSAPDASLITQVIYNAVEDTLTKFLEANKAEIIEALGRGTK